MHACFWQSGLFVCLMILSLFLCCRINGTEHIDYLMTCKLVAIISFAQKEQRSQSGGKTKKKPYKQMLRTRTVVTYNSMGERVVHREKEVDLGYLADGILKGYFSDIQKLWNEQTSRIDNKRHYDSIDSSDIQVTDALPIILSKIPLSFRQIFQKRYVSISPAWAPEVPHWLDFRRAIRISRTILDRRLALQRDSLFGVPLGEDILSAQKKPPSVPSLQQITATYFERNYGSPELNVSHTKAMHFLEACFQYSSFAVLETMKKFLCPDESNAHFSDTCAWFYVEARDFFYSGGYIVHSDSLPGSAISGDPGSIMDSITIDSSSSITTVSWERIPRSAAIDCAVEMFQKRGHFGPSAVNRATDLMMSLPIVQLDARDYSKLTEAQDEDWIDMEHCLDAMTAFLDKLQRDLASAKDRVFSMASVPRDTRAVSAALQADDKAFDTEAEGAFMADLLHMCHLFMAFDVDRTGIIPETPFDGVLRKMGLKLLKLSSVRHGRGMMNACRQLFLDPGTKGIGYIDFVAVLLSSVFQDRGLISNGGPDDFLQAVQTTTRGIEEREAGLLLFFLGSEQVPWAGGINPLWTLSAADIRSVRDHIAKSTQHVPGGNKATNPKALTSNSHADAHAEAAEPEPLGMIPRDGNWYPGTRAVPDNPGLITVTKVVPVPSEGGTGERFLGVDGASWRSEAQKDSAVEKLSGHGSSSYVPSTNREVTSVLGEMSRKVSKKVPAAITPQDLSSSFSTSQLTGAAARAQATLNESQSAPQLAAVAPEGSTGTSQRYGGSISPNDKGSVGSASLMSTRRAESSLGGGGGGGGGVFREASQQSSLSPSRSRPPAALDHAVMGSTTRLGELEGTSLAASQSTGALPKSPASSGIILRKNEDERRVDSRDGRYTVQSRATGPVVPARDLTDEELEYYKEEQRLREYRKPKVTKILADHRRRKRSVETTSQSLNDSDSGSLLSINEFGSTSEWHEGVLVDMSLTRKGVIKEEEEATKEMEEERRLFMANLQGRQRELLLQKQEMRRKELEALKKAREDDLIKEERRQRQREEERRLREQEAAEQLRREAEEKERIERERQRRAELLNEKRLQEALMLERRGETDNLMAMRKEEQYSIAAEHEINERIR
jgi:hypothetical protein